MAQDNGTGSGDDIGQSPYRSPSAAIGGVAADSSDIMAAFLGPKNTAFYKRVFAGFESGGGVVSWNWPACLATWFWLAYRKMWAWFFLYWLVWPFVVLLAATLVTFVHPVLTVIVYFSGYFIIPPIVANRLYYRHALNKIARAHFATQDANSHALEAARLGGTSNVVVVLIPAMVVIIGILAAISIPAYQDYTIRAQVAEGLNLSSDPKAAVAEYYEDNGHAPADNAAAGLAAAEEISGKYVLSVAVNEGLVTVTYGNEAHQVLVDRELHITPSDNAGLLSWTCSSPTIAPRHLPKICR